MTFDALTIAGILSATLSGGFLIALMSASGKRRSSRDDSRRRESRE